MRIRTDGKHARREETIEDAAEFWNRNKTTALMKSAEFSVRIDQRIRQVLARDDLTLEQKREIADSLSVPNCYELEIEEAVTVSR